MNLLIKGARIVDPVSGLDGVRDILIEDGKISKLAPDLVVPEHEQVRIIEADGLVAAPGLMDAHVHFRDPGQTYKEDITTGAAAAARGGFTRVVCMANTKPAVDTPQVLEDILQRGKETGIEVLQASCITKGLHGQELVDMPLMAKSGAAGFTDDGIPIMDEKLLYEAMEQAASLDLPMALHEEDPAFVPGAGVNQGRVSELLGYAGAAAMAEEVLTARDCVLALHSKAAVCIQHISAKNSVEIVRAAKAMGADVHAEATPHHFTLTEDAVLQYGTNARMNPPLRTEEDRQAIIAGLQDGTIDMIVTDHAPHAAEEKAQPLPKAPSGIIGLETSLALGIKSLVQPGYMTLMGLIEKMSTNPARFYRIKPASIAEGEDADLVLFGPNETWLVDFFASKSSNSPFLGWTLPGKVRATICKGKIVYEA